MKSDVLPVLLPAASRLTATALRERAQGMPTWRLRGAHGAVLFIVFLVGCGIAQAQAGATQPSILLVAFSFARRHPRPVSTATALSTWRRSSLSR